MRSTDIVKPRAAEVLGLEYFQAEPATMPTLVFDEHHILFNLRDEPQRVENWRNGTHRDFTFRKNEIVVTPAGIKSGWRCYGTSECIVVTIIPAELDRFSTQELGLLRDETQLIDKPQFEDADLTGATVMLRDALQDRRAGYEVMYESLARVFVVKLRQSYGLERAAARDFGSGFTARRYKRVLDFLARNFGRQVSVEEIASEAGMSAAHFSRLFKDTIGETPHQFLTSFRIERAREMLADGERPMIEIALACGFADQPHFSRTFLRVSGQTPREFRKNLP
ncbi:helix-turn-helix domain-containing protein [Roseovarius sp. C03]|uniref:helix-turn-helix domain-containing protein n=1 Tax=Roseovarius sp. C03 TaxID=3449222 RepID=UPI003EDC600A